jgi:hypothetical protein
MRLDAESLRAQAEWCAASATYCDERAVSVKARVSGQRSDWETQASWWREEAAALGRLASEVEVMRSLAPEPHEIVRDAVLAEKRARAHAILERAGMGP